MNVKNLLFVVIPVIGIMGTSMPVFASEDTEEAQTENRDFATEIKTLLRDSSEGTLIEFGTYEQDNDEENGKEPIYWIVADKNTAPGYCILISEYGLDYKPYNDEDTDVTWETCSLRKWLNEDFYNEAFSDEEKELVTQVRLTNEDSKNYGTSGGNDTYDCVWIMDEAAVDYYMTYTSENNGQVVATKYAQGLGADEIASYWLRTPGREQSGAIVAYYHRNFGEVWDKATTENAVRPLIALPVAEKEAVPKKESPRVDMTEEEVKNSTWGEPEEIETYLDNEERWIYTENKYIWFRDGIVTRIVDKKDPKIGMTPEEVKESTWGSPESIRTTETAKGTTELWVYPGGKFIHFEKNKVTMIER